MSRAFWMRVGGAALLGFVGGAIVDINKFRKREDKSQRFNWWIAAEEWLLAGLAAGAAAAGVPALSSLPAPASD